MTDTSTDNDETGNEHEHEHENNLDLDEVEVRINNLHNTLDQIKNSGTNIGTQLSIKAGEAEPDEKERYNHLIYRANLLSKRLEFGDRAIVRGE